MKDRAEFKEQLINVPRKPGVYVFKDSEGQILYIGKGKSLVNRMRSYFQKSSNLTPKTRALVKRIADFEFYVTENELEALVLECNLIKKVRPPFNVSYRDDKSYPYVAVTVVDRFPRILVTRERHRRGTKYFGPYASAFAVRETYDTLQRIFPFRTCRGKEPGKVTGSPCLNYHIKRCLGPCAGKVSAEEYGQMIKQVSLFLEGRPEQVIRQLEDEMNEASAGLQYEKAARLRDRLTAARQVLFTQTVVTETGEDHDVIGLAFDGELACVNVSMVRGGKLIGSQNFTLNQGTSESETLGSFVEQHYLDSPVIPAQILLPFEPPDASLLEDWLSRKLGRRVRLAIPKRGTKKKLMGMALMNAKHALEVTKTKESWDDAEQAMKDLGAAISLPKTPRRIECFDISTTGGSSSVGSMVVFENGVPKRDHYRKFKIRLTLGLNDYAMMREILSRRLEAMGKRLDQSFSAAPDLIIVDGGRPQLSAALEAMKDVGVSGIPVAALAKKLEELYLPEADETIRLATDDKSLRLIQRVRDEAHRFAVAYHRGLRGKQMVVSELDRIPGIGANRKRLLLKYFGSPGSIAKASLEELQAVPGLPDTVALRIHKHFSFGG